MTIALRRFGVEVIPYVPSRLEEGHGLSRAAIEAAAAAGATRDRDRRLRLDERGRDRRGERRVASTSSSPTTTASRRICPPALALVNPHRADSHLPRSPAGGERRRVQGRPAAARRRARRTGGGPRPGGPRDDRDRRRRGARSSARTGRSRGSASSACGGAAPGIAALLERARIAPAAVDLETVAFALAPRLNAAGRVGEALEAARLLLAEDRPRRPPTPTRSRRPIWSVAT